MQAQPGDWAVVDDNGTERSVAADVFQSTHEQIGPERYRRCGTVMARPAVPGEVIATLEGHAVANPGDWVLRGEGGETWPVSDHHFRHSYEGPVATAQ